MNKPTIILSVLIGFFLSGALAFAQELGTPGACNEDLDYAQVVGVRADRTGSTWRFSVTVRHADSGWDHYADEWQVVDPETGVVYGTRVLAHPHVQEQPFTRSQSGIEIPAHVEQVLVRARCNVHGYGGCGMLVSTAD